jgi:ABC-type branched-subunit amino acid transport system substrate-binding protein
MSLRVQRAARLYAVQGLAYRRCAQESIGRRQTMIRFIMPSLVVLAGATLGMSGALAQGKAGGETVRIAFVDPLSGPFAAVGQNLLKHFQFAAEVVNSRQLAGPGVRFEVVAFDNKGSPQETLTLLRSMIDPSSSSISSP